MIHNIKIFVVALCFVFFTANVFAQKAADLVGTWKVDYEATKALMSAEDKEGFTEEVEKMIKPMMNDMVYKFAKGGGFELYLGGDKISQDGSKWSLKGKSIVLNSPRGPKTLEVKELSKSKVVWYDKDEKGGFKTTLLVPAN